MEVRFSGGEEFARAARRLRSITPAEHQKELRDGISRALRGASAAVKTSVPSYMPSGYAPVLGGALRIRTKQTVDGVQVTARAMGKSHPRKIGDLERGLLRAPSYPRGRRTAWSWHAQRIRPRFFTEPIARAAPKVRAELVKVMQSIADRIVGG